MQENYSDIARVRMKPFLQKLTEELVERHNGNLADVCLVFPTRRAGIYFKKYFAQQLKAPAWSPVIFSIQDFIRSLSKVKIPDQLTLMFELHTVYQKYFPSETFEKFYPWGEMLLKDFDDADRALADTRQLFTYIKDIREIETNFELSEEELERIKNFWKIFFEKEPGALKKEFADNWQHLGNIYSDFKNVLHKKHLTYEGLAYRNISEQLNSEELKLNYKEIVFAGFYALSNAEEQIISHCIKKHNAKIYWDSDEYYTDDLKQEAGTFLRNHSLVKQNYKWKEKYFSSDEKNIQIVGVPLQAGQAKFAGQMLNEKFASGEFNESNTAVVLPDELQLFPVLYSLPASVQAINVTMGYPLHYSPLYNLFESLFLLQKNIRVGKNKISFYHKHALAIINHPYILSIEQEKTNQWMMNYNEHHYTQITSEDLFTGNSPGCFKNIFRKVADGSDVFEYCKSILQIILQSMKQKQKRFHDLETEYVYHFYLQLKRLEDIIAQNNAELNIETFWNLFKEIIFAVKIPFAGEPLKGLQVIGFLETRLLDFENIFILSMNEDVLPASGNHPSFIPYNIRKAFGLPTYENQNAVSAYHFYRLLQRAKNIYLIYNTEVKSITAGEKSRFLVQIENEMCKKYPQHILLHKKTLSTDLVETEVQPIIIHKTESVMNDLNKYFLKTDAVYEYSKRLSASSLNSYISCPLKFYFQKVAKLEEVEETEENIEAASFGKILHKTMQLMYDENKNLTAIVIDELLKRVEIFVDRAVKEEYNSRDALEGKNILIREVIVELVKKILQADKASAPIKIKHLEQKYFLPVSISPDKKILLNGYIDRVDEVETITRIIDYKTGRVNEKKSESMEQLFSDPKFKEQLQTLFYAYLHKNNSTDTFLKSGLFSVRKMASGISFFNDGEIISSEQFAEFENNLIKLMQEIFNPDIPFTQTAEEERCTYCAYKETCHR